MQTQFPAVSLFVSIDQIERFPLEIRDRLSAGEQLVLTDNGIAIAKLAPYQDNQKDNSLASRGSKS